MNHKSNDRVTIVDDFLFVKNKPSYSGVIELLNFFALMLLAFCIPLYKPFLLYAIALWVGTWLLEGGKIHKIKTNLNKRSVVYLFILSAVNNKSNQMFISTVIQVYNIA